MQIKVLVWTMWHASTHSSSCLLPDGNSTICFAACPSWMDLVARLWGQKSCYCTTSFFRDMMWSDFCSQKEVLARFDRTGMTGFLLPCFFCVMWRTTGLLFWPEVPVLAPLLWLHCQQHSPGSLHGACVFIEAACDDAVFSLFACSN